MRLRTHDITWREIDGDLVILDLCSSTFLTADPVGTVLMRELAEERTLQQLVQALADTLGVPDAQAHRDVVAFVEYLDEHGLLENGRGTRRASTVAWGA